MTRAGRLIVVGTATALLVAIVAIALYRRLEPPPMARRPPVAWPTVVTTIAGAGAPGMLEGRGPAAAFSDPFGVAVDPAGDTWLSDAGENNAIWRISDDGNAAKVAGGCEGFRDGQGPHACFNSPSALAVDGSGSVIVADTANNAIRRISPAGVVATIAGNGQPGTADGASGAARFNGPIGVAVAPDGRIVVADTYNDRIREIAADGTVSTLSGGGGRPEGTEGAEGGAEAARAAGAEGAPGFRDGRLAEALFDTPSGVAVDREGTIYVADTGNDAIRRIGVDGQVTTIARSVPRPVGIATLPPSPRGARSAADRTDQTAPDTIFVTDAAGRVLLLASGRDPVVLSNGWPGLRFRNPCGIAVAGDGTLRASDSDNYLVRRLTRPGEPRHLGDIDMSPVPGLDANTLRLDVFPWPLEPQERWHEVAATLGEARGSLGGDGRERLHSGIDVRGPVGAMVRAVRDEKVQRPIGAVGFGSLNESLRVGVVSYVHVRVGRTRRGLPLDATRFAILSDGFGRPARVRVRRGTRVHAGDPLGTINPFAHVHLGVGPPGAEINPLDLPLPGFVDRVPPTIEADGVQLYSETGQRLGLVESSPSAPGALRLRDPGLHSRRGAGRRGRVRPPPKILSPVPVSGRVSVVVDAYDRVDGNRASRRLGVYALGYQVLRDDGTPVDGVEAPRTTIEFDRLPGDPDAPQMIYAQGSGITVYGNRTTRFRYVVTNSLRGGIAGRGTWDTSTLAPGTYRLRVVARDIAGNEATREIRVIKP